MDEFASKHGASTWKNFPTDMPWQHYFMETLLDSNTKIVFNLACVSSVNGVIQRGAAGLFVHVTDWEIYLIYSHPEVWDRVTWFINDVEVANPFYR